MTRKTLLTTLLLALPVSSLLVACGDGGDTADRTALEREALERDLDLALKPDTTPEVALRDVALVDSLAGQTPAPVTEQPKAPAPRAPQPAPPRPAPAPSRPAEPSGPRYVTRTVGSGTTLTVRFDNQVSTRNVSEGSTFSTTLSHDLTDSQGRTVIPAGATVRGRVTRAVASGRAGQSPDLGVTFTSISYGGDSYPIDVTMVDAPAVRRVSRQSRGQTAATVAGGAAVGAVAGRVLGKSRRSTVIGAVVGGAAGTAVAVGTHDVDAVINAGSTATVRLDGPVRVRKEA